MAGPGLKKGTKSFSGSVGDISAHSDDTKGPKRPSDNPVSHPNDGKTGGVPLGKKLTPKGNV